MNAKSVIVFLFLCSSTSFGQVSDLNTLLMNSTFKIQQDRKLGTCFILGRPMRTNPKQAYYVLITANHVLDSLPKDRANIILRTKTGNSYSRLPHQIQIRRNGIPLWTKHPDVDVAAMYVDIPDEAYLTLLPMTFLASDSILSYFEVHPGDELFSLGYPYGAEANEAGFPILRSGKISSYPLLPVKLVKTFLFDFEVFGGNSGGPVYFVESNRVYAGGTHTGIVQFIIGIAIQEKIMKEKSVTMTESREIFYKLGLANVVHANFIRETIEMLSPLD